MLATRTLRQEPEKPEPKIWAKSLDFNSQTVQGFKLQSTRRDTCFITSSISTKMTLIQTTRNVKYTYYVNSVCL